MIGWLLSRATDFYNIIERFYNKHIINLKFKWQLNNFFFYKKYLFNIYPRYYNIIINFFTFYFRFYNWYPLIKKNGYLNSLFENSKKIIKYNKKK